MSSIRTATNINNSHKRRERWQKLQESAVFFSKAGNDSTALATWYQTHLGMALEDFGGAVLRWPDDKAEDQGLTVWHVAEKEKRVVQPQRLGVHDQLSG